LAILFNEDERSFCHVKPIGMSGGTQDRGKITRKRRWLGILEESKGLESVRSERINGSLPAICKHDLHYPSLESSTGLGVVNGSNIFIVRLHELPPL
jgi:hypothetical protein